MASLNKVMVIGNLGKDPEMRYLPSGSAVADFSVAVDRKVRPRDGGEARDETEWFNVVAFDKLAETCNQYLVKGRQVYIEGRLQTRTWDDQQGQKHYRTEVVAQVMQLLGSPPSGARSGDEGTGPAAPDEDDIPF